MTCIFHVLHAYITHMHSLFISVPWQAVGSNKSSSAPIRTSVASFTGGRPWTTGSVMFYGESVIV